jgi:tetraacyldisaccharide-1-P 4'-kinase
VCGIGRPEGFRAAVQGLGAEVVRSLFFPDHYWYTHKDFATLRAISGQVDFVVTTEKDAWKLRGLHAQSGDFLALRVDLELDRPDLLRAHLERVFQTTRIRPGA